MTTFAQIYGHNPVRRISKTHLKAPSKQWDINFVNHLIGLEIEVEGVRNNIPITPAWWEALGDGSLRNNGIELRSLAFPIQHTPEVLDDALVALQKSNGTHQFTERCSGHVHVNFQDVEVGEFLKLCIVYAMIEKPLFDFAAPERYFSSFTVPFYEIANSEGVRRMMVEYAKTKTLTFDLLTPIIQDLCPGKYSAFNLINLPQARQGREHSGSGSIEFRHLGGENYAKKMLTWVKLIALLLAYTHEVTWEALREQVFSLNTTSEYGAFLTSIFKHYSHHLFTDPHTVPVFSHGVSFAKELLVTPDVLKVQSKHMLLSPLALILQERIANEGGEHDARKKRYEAYGFPVPDFNEPQDHLEEDPRPRSARERPSVEDAIRARILENRRRDEEERDAPAATIAGARAADWAWIDTPVTTIVAPEPTER